MSETVELALLAAGTAAVVALAGALVLHALRGRSLGAQVAGVAVVAVVGVGVGAWAGARAMFFSEHDLWALGVILVAAGTVAVASALLLGRRVEAASEALVGVARRIGDGDSPPNGPPPAAPQELARLHRELELTSRRLEEARTREHALDSSRHELVAWVS